MAKLDKRFMLLHLSFVPRLEPRFDTFKVSREQWLSFTSQDRTSFLHRENDDLHWLTAESGNSLIFGLLKQIRGHALHRPPEESGEEVGVEERQGAPVLTDAIHHQYGQKAALRTALLNSPARC